MKVDKLDPQRGTALEIGTSGDTISVPSGATLDISASTLTPPATMPASSGINFTALNATNLGSGTVPTARLGTGTASSSTVLYGDQTYKAEPGGGKVLQIQSMTYGTQESSNATTYENSSVTDSITPASTSNDILIIASVPYRAMKTGTSSVVTRARGSIGLFRGDKDGTKLTDANFGWNGSTSDGATGNTSGGVATFSFLDSPSTTSAQSYMICFHGIDTTNYTMYLQDFMGANAVSSMILIEIDGT